MAGVASVAVVVAAAVGAGHFFSVRSAAAAAPVNTNCTLIVPANPLTAQGLATPYQLTATDPAAGPCNEANPNQTAFVQGAIIDPATGQISVYNPLVIDAGTQPAVAPVPPVLPAGAVAAVWFGFNGDVLSFKGAGQAGTATTVAGRTRQARFGRPAAAGAPDAVLQQANCIVGENIGGAFSPFNQVGACNAVAFFQAANAAIQAGMLTVPSPGTARDGQPCLTTRDFALIDQDQSDNVTTEYLANGNGQIAQNTAANQQALAGAVTLANGSDNGLLDFFVAPALGCTPWTAPDLANGGAPVTALPLDELQAAAFAGQSGGPAALVPLNDPMVLDGNGRFNTAKADAYRSIMDQPPLPAGETPAQYCGDMESIQGVRLQQDVNLLTGAPSPMPSGADNLFTFLAMRLQQSFGNLNCQNFGLRNDVSTTVNAAGVVVAACFLQQVNAVTPGPGNPTAGMTVCPATTATASATPTAPAAATTPAMSAAPTAAATPAASGTAAPTAAPTAPAPTAPAPTASGGATGTPVGGNAGVANRKHQHWWY